MMVYDHVVFFAERMPLLNEYRSFVNNQCQSMLILSGENFENAFEAFNQLFIPANAAGGIVRNREGQILFIIRHEIPDLPKGKLCKEETFESAALREVEEETGLTGLSIIKPLTATYHIYADRGGNEVLKKTCWFEMLYTGSETPHPQLEEDITEVRWVPVQEAKELMQKSYNSLKELFSQYIDS